MNNIFTRLGRNSYSALFISSGLATTCLLSLRGEIYQRLIGLICSVIILIYFEYKNYSIQKFKDKKSRIIILSLIFSIVSLIYLTYFFYLDFNVLLIIINAKLGLDISTLILITITSVILIGMVAFFFVFYLYTEFFNCLENFINDFLKRLDKPEVTYLIVCSIYLIIFVILIFSLTSLFHNPITVEGWGINDALFTTDSSLLNKFDTFININGQENDIRQPLFGLFTLPFGIFSKLLSYVLFFIPNSYYLILSIVQIIVLEISIILLVRLINPKSIHKLILLFFINSLFSYMLFSLIIEQYIFSLFWIILLIYLSLEKNKINIFSYIGATGSMITSGVLFLLNFNIRNIWNSVRDMLQLLIKLLSVLIVFGQLPILLNSVISIPYLMRFAKGSIPFINRFFQYTYFLRTSFIYPSSQIVVTDQVVYRYHLSNINNFSYIGLILILLYFISYFINRRNKIVQISFFWFLFSFIILCMIGWGTSENGLILYQLYFSWAFIILFYQGIVKIIRNDQLVLYIFIGLFILLFVLNMRNIIEIIQFGMKYYPI